MSEHIDHAAEARRLHGVARGIITDKTTAFAPHMAAVILLDEARLEAQLALVEQQRIANLIALLKPEDPRGYDVWPEIAEGLGLPS